MKFKDYLAKKNMFESTNGKQYLIPAVHNNEAYLYVFIAEKSIHHHPTRTRVTSVASLGEKPKDDYQSMGFYGISMCLEEECPTIITLDQIMLGAEIAKKAGITMVDGKHDYTLPDNIKHNPVLINRIKRVEKHDLGDEVDVMAKHQLGGYNQDDYGLYSNREI